MHRIAVSVTGFVALLALATGGLAPTISNAVAEEAASPGDDSSGEALFTKICGRCHEATPNGDSEDAPNLYGIVGSRVGSGEYPWYTDALRDADFAWTAEQLDRFLADPRNTLQGNAMGNIDGAVRDPQMRADIIAYLSTLSDR